MRSIFLFIVIVFAGFLPAQNYTQNAPPVQQTKAADDCYTRNLDSGNAALRRGEARGALRFFKEAKNCPEAQGNTRRQSELDARIAKCEEQLGLKPSSVSDSKEAEKATPNNRKRSFSSESSNARRDYPANRDFLKDTVAECFQRMVGEADRAFQLRFWEDAAALYRAAKNCADADQGGRQKMSEKIIACRDAAENELFAKQQEAERQARHAIAANLADDAQELLRSTDRSLAFRLADFANQYVAPDDNNDCVQAMFDAWYYQSLEESKHRLDELYRPAFCYELADNLGENTQVKFQPKKNGKQLLWAFVPKTGDMYAWELPSMKLVQAYGLGEGNGYTGFDFSPAGDLLFWGNKFFELRSGTRLHRVAVPAVANRCFSARGDEFFFENTEEHKIYVLNVREALAQHTRKSTKNATVYVPPAEPREMVSNLADGLLAMEYVDGKFWLGFRDRVEVLGKPEPGKPWKREKVIPFDGVAVSEFVEQKEIRLSLAPKDGFAVLGASGSWFIPLEQNADSSATPRKLSAFETMYPLAVSPSAHQVAGLYFSDARSNGLWLMDAHTGDTLLHQWLLPSISYEPMCGTFSANANWLAAADYWGTVCVWNLQNSATSQVDSLPLSLEYKPVFSPDGNRLSIALPKQLAVYNTAATESPEHLLPLWGESFKGKSNHWVLLQVAPDSAEAWNLTDGRRWRFPLSPTPDQGPFFFAVDSEEENLLAYVADWNTVHLRSLKTGELLASKAFDGGTINSLRFLPNSKELLVAQPAESQSSAKIWSPLQASGQLRAVRLPDYYNIKALTLDNAGEWLALSNGGDIRVFELQNLENEWMKMRKIKTGQIQAIAFRPNSNLLAAAYATGEVVFWDIQTGQAVLELQAVPSKGLVEAIVEIVAMGFADEGKRLHLAVSDGRFFSYQLDDPDYIRLAAQGEGRFLQSFSSEQIHRYNLEAALYYPGNFEQLVESGDAPLKRSFFEYFREEALSSNNVQRVRDYCERAFYLYERLSENTQKLWKADMRVMYEDYASKLLLRNNTVEATKVAAFIKQKFDFQPRLIEAHAAFLNGNFAIASERYSDFILTHEDGLPMSLRADWATNKVERDWSQFSDYELLDSAQMNYVCGFSSLLGKTGDSNCKQALPFSPSDRARWEVFQALHAAGNNPSYEAKTRHFEMGFQKAQALARQNPVVGQAWAETAVLELAQTHRDWGVFEQSSPESPLHFETAIQLLADFGAFKKLPDTSRLSLIASTQLFLGTYFLKIGKTTDAILRFDAGLQAAQQLIYVVEDTTFLRSYYDNLLGPLHKEIGAAYFLEGKPIEARQAYEQASVYYTNGLNQLYFGNVSVLENNETQALLEYENIFDVSHTAIVYFELDGLAERFPEKRSQIDAFISKLRAKMRTENRRLVNVEADYWYANFKVNRFAARAQWDSAIVWTSIAMQNAKRCAELPNMEEYWTGIWLDEHINLPYYLLLGRWNKPEALEEAVRYAEAAETFLEKQNPPMYYANREILKTNLAHALVLRNKPGDRERAIKLYNDFFAGYASPFGYSTREMLKKDFRDLKRQGAPWPELPELEGTVRDER